MHIESTVPRKTIIEKRALPGTGMIVYGATDRFGGKVTFVAEEDHAIGESVALPTKPDGPMTVEAFWKKSGQSIPITAVSGMIAVAPSAAKALGTTETAKFLVKQAGLPEALGTAKPVEDVVGRTIKISENTVFRHLAIFSATFLLVVGLQRVWAPERSRDAALVTAGILAACATGLYALLA